MNTAQRIGWFAWCLAVGAVGCGCLRPASAENAFGLTLTPPGPERPWVIENSATVQAQLGRSPSVLTLRVPMPVMNSGSVRDGEDRSRRAGVRGKELTWFLVGGTLLSMVDRNALRHFDTDLGERDSRGDAMPRHLSALGTGVPMLVAIGAPYALDGAYGRKTTRLALAAVVDAMLITGTMKFMTGKERPFESGGGIRFHGPGSGHSSFPSGHTSASFAVATVLGRRYPRYRVALLLLASAIGYSRISSARHFPSDVFVGAGIGVYAGRRAVATNGRILGLEWRF